MMDMQEKLLDNAKRQVEEITNLRLTPEQCDALDAFFLVENKEKLDRIADLNKQISEIQAELISGFLQSIKP